MPATAPTIAYFSMEIAVEASISTYTGGLGVLAGDTLRTADALVSQSYFHQSLETCGIQHETAEQWDPAGKLQRLDPVARLGHRGF